MYGFLFNDNLDKSVIKNYQPFNFVYYNCNEVYFNILVNDYMPFFCTRVFSNTILTNRYHGLDIKDFLVKKLCKWLTREKDNNVVSNISFGETFSKSNNKKLICAFQSPSIEAVIRSNIIIICGNGFIGINNIGDAYFQSKDSINKLASDVDVMVCMMIKSEYQEYVKLSLLFSEPIDPQVLELWVDSRISKRGKDNTSPIKPFIKKDIIPLVEELGIPIVYKDNLTSLIFKSPKKPKAKTISEYENSIKKMLE